MACRYYDDAVVAKLKRWAPEATGLRVLRPDETKRLFALTAEDKKDKPLTLPLIALSRNNDIQLLSVVKSQKSFNGLVIDNTVDKTIEFNVLPIRLNYQLDIYAKTVDDGDELVRNFLFKLINNPSFVVEIPYNGTNVKHIANIRLMDTVADTSEISERIFPGQFSRFTIQFEIQDAFYFSIPYRNNWKIYLDPKDPDGSMLEVSEKITEEGEIEPIN